MWKDLPIQEREEYKKMILAFTSLTEMFAQKSDDDSSIQLSPIINSKYQETVFQRVFDASAEDIGNTSYDASIEYINNDSSTTKYLIGIKTFGCNSGQQKVAQFKANHIEWEELIHRIKENSIGDSDAPLSKEKINHVNHDLYLTLAKEIATLRNKRIESSEANLKGFDVHAKGDNVQAVYHVLMPSKKGEAPCIYVGETNYDKINVDNIHIIGCTSPKNPTNFDFDDGNHIYRFTAADSQLLMDFTNQDIVQEKWDVKYADDAYDIFAQIAHKVYNPDNNAYKHKQTTESYSWLITNQDREVERYSGFNAFYGGEC